MVQSDAIRANPTNGYYTKGYMKTIFFIGIGVNVAGAILLAAYAIKYYLASKEAARMPMRMAELRSQWFVRRRRAFGMMIGGAIITYLATLIK